MYAQEDVSYLHLCQLRNQENGLRTRGIHPKIPATEPPLLPVLQRELPDQPCDNRILATAEGTRQLNLDCMTPEYSIECVTTQGVWQTS